MQSYNFESLGSLVQGDDRDRSCDWESLKAVDKRDSFASETTNKSSFSSVSEEKSNRIADNFEPINIEGQIETGIWVHQPGSEVSQTWEPRKGKSRRLDTEIQREPTDYTGSHNAAAPGSQDNDSSSDKNPYDKHSLNPVRRGLRKIGSVFHSSPKKEDSSINFGETVLSPHANIKAVNRNGIGVRFVVEDDLARPASAITPKDGASSSGGSGPDSPGKGNMKDRAKSILKHAEKSARSIKHVLSRKVSRKSLGDPSPVTGREILADSDYSDDESLPSSPGAGKLTLVAEDKSKDEAVQTGVVNNLVDTKGPTKEASPEGTQ